MKFVLQAVSLLIVSGITSACEEGADVIGVGKYCYSEGEKVVTCTCPFSHCDYEPNPFAEYGVYGKCQLSDDAIVFITFWVIFGVVGSCVIAWLCCCRGDGASFRGFCKGGCLCTGADAPTEKRVIVPSESSVSTDDTSTSVSTASSTASSTDNSSTSVSKNEPDQV